MNHILMVGLGSIGQRHLRNILLSSSELFGGLPAGGANAPDPPLRIDAYRVRGEQEVLTAAMHVQADQDLTSVYPIAEVYRDLKQALAARPDFVFICNPTAMHVPVALAAAEAGCHLFIEKPLAHSMEGVDRLIAEVEARGTTALVGHQLRFHPCVHTLESWWREGRVGRPLWARLEVGEYLPGWHPWEDYRRSYAARSDQGGGVILTQCHELDYALSIFGMPQQVTAYGGHLSGLEIDVEDVAVLLLQCSFEERPLPVTVHMDYLQKPPSRNCRVVGEAGCIEMDLVRQRIEFVGRGGAVDVRDFDGYDRNQLFIDELRHFYACVRGQETPRVSLRDARAGLRIALAAKTSLTERRTVAL